MIESYANGLPFIGERVAIASSYDAPLQIVDIASAAITTTTTTANINPSYGVSYQVNIAVTAVSGTNPTLDVSIEESADGGVNWFKVYDFPRITGVGSYNSPAMPMTGTLLRYVQTVGGTTPSFTRSINRNQSNMPAAILRQLINRTIDLNTLNSVTPSILTGDAGNQVKLVVSIGAATTPPSLQLEGSEDNGLTWTAIGSPLAAVASSTVSVNVSGQNWQQIRARVSTAGVGATPNFVLVKAHD